MRERVAALRRLRAIGDLANRERLGWAVRIRWLAIGGFSALAGLAWVAGVLASLWPCLIAGGSSAVINAVNQHCVRRGRGLAAITAAAISADSLLTTYLIAATGGPGSPFVMLYVVEVVATAMLVDLWVAAAVAVAAAAGLIGALWLGLATPLPPPAGALAQAVWGLFLFYSLALLTFLGGYLAERLRFSENSLRATARRLRATEAQLVQSEKLRALGQFVAGIAHELNNPIGFVSAAIDPLREAIAGLGQALDAPAPLAPETARRLARQRAELPGLLDDCAEGARRAAEIVAALRAFARGGEEAWSRVDLTERLERTLTLLRHRLGAQVRVVRDYAVTPPLTCLAGQLDQVWLNLLANACDAVGARGTITVRTRLGPPPPGSAHAGPHLVVAIGDDGPGIAPSLQSRVFDPFFTTKPEGAGTGLGLSVSYAIVERHGGAIELGSEPGRGCEFRVALPLARRLDT
ncbi:MAG: ATP-binding protein [Deltaproteobacteria bacterium]|nr:ATP-binding protein [Deltaproteobacteria bacterium]